MTNENENEHIPLYMRFHDQLRDELISYQIGSNIPSERALCEKYGIDRFNVRKALSLLVEEGYIERKQGSGTRVLRHGPSHNGRVLFLLCQGNQRSDRLGEPFYARSLDALEEKLQKAGDMHLLYSKLNSGDSLTEICANLNARAIILAGSPDPATLEQCRNLNIPLVGYNTKLDNLPSVVADNDEGAATAVQYLLQLGHKHIGFIHVPGYINSDRRLSSFKIEMRNTGLNTKQFLHIAEGDWTEEGGYQAARELLSAEGSQVSAIFGGNDAMAIGALRAVRDAGLRVPEDVSVIGFDGIMQSALTQPALTTAQVDVSAMAEAACMLLNHVVNCGATRGVRAVVSAELLVRGSTAAPNKEKI